MDRQKAMPAFLSTHSKPLMEAGAGPGGEGDMLRTEQTLESSLQVSPNTECVAEAAADDS